jgi:hypothetical protein
MANGNGRVTVSNGVDSVQFARFVGKTVGQVRDDSLVVESFNLSGDEQASVTRGDNPAESVDNRFVLRSGDVLSFTRQSGEKGSV